MAQRETERPHICLYIGSLYKGGAERVMTNLAEYFYAQGWRVTFVTPNHFDPEYAPPHRLWDAKTGEPYDEATAAALPWRKGQEGLPGEETGIRRIYSTPPQEKLSRGRVYGFLARYRMLRKIWKREKPDLILSFIGYNNSFAIATSLGLGIPVVISVRSNPAYEYPTAKLKAMAFAAFRFADGVVLQTHQAAEFFPKAVQRKAVVLPNAVNEAFLRPHYEGERDKRVVCVGRIDDNKNQGLLIEQFARAHRSHPEYTLHIYGTGPAQEKFERLAEKLGVGESVFFEGVVDNVADRIERAEIYVLPSKTEGMPNALLEAMSLGLACIATDCPCGGPRELIRDGVNGFLVPVGSAESTESRERETPEDDGRGGQRRPTMAGRLVQLMDDPELAARLGREAARVQESCSPEKVCGQWRDYLLGIMKR